MHSWHCPDIKTKDSTKKKLKTNINTDAKILNKTLANQIQESTERITYTTKQDLSQIHKVGSVFENQLTIINRLKKNNHMVLLINVEKAFDKNITPIHNKNSQQSRTKGEFFHLDRLSTQIYTNIILSGENLKLCH